jgi:hypothetical protein
MVEDRSVTIRLKRATPAMLRQLAKGRWRELNVILDALAAKCAPDAAAKIAGLMGEEPGTPDSMGRPRAGHGGSCSSRSSLGRKGERRGGAATGGMRRLSGLAAAGAVVHKRCHPPLTPNQRMPLSTRWMRS